MATASRVTARRVNAIGLVAVVAIAAVIYVVGRDDSPTRSSSSPDDVVAVTSDTRHRFTDLDAMAAATDLVVAGRVVAVEPGRAFGGVDASGDADPNAIRSQVVTVEIEDAIAHRDAVAPPAAGTVILIEEEAELADGTPITVDGASRARVGVAGIWFLVASADPEFPGFTVVNSQGRYLVARPDAAARTALAGPVRGSDRTDELVRRLQSLGFAGLADAAGVAMAAA